MLDRITPKELSANRYDQPERCALHNAVEKTISYSNFPELRERLAGLRLGSMQPEDVPQCFVYSIEVSDAEDSALGSQQATLDHLQPSRPDDGWAQQA